MFFPLRAVHCLGEEKTFGVRVSHQHNECGGVIRVILFLFPLSLSPSAKEPVSGSTDIHIFPFQSIIYSHCGNHVTIFPSQSRLRRVGKVYFRCACGCSEPVCTVERGGVSDCFVCTAFRTTLPETGPTYAVTDNVITKQWTWFAQR